MVVVPDSVRGGLGRGERPQEVGGSGGSSKEQQEPGGLQVRKAGDFPEVTLMVREARLRMCRHKGVGAYGGA